ncbi:MAG TPA: NAD(+)/NADH kinase [Planctomycetota bacterium]|nr:NAD(+)/NADH kinase [Planctomycetota bacterium]
MTKTVRRILVVTKPSLLELEGEPNPEAVRARLLRRDIETRQSVYDVFHALARRKVRFEVVGRAAARSARGFDLVVVVGGDGTFMTASHGVDSQPVLCVNSDPESSLSLFSCCDRRSFGEAFDAARAGRMRLTRLNRLRVSIGGRELPFAVTNDILYTHRNPVSMTRYTLEVNGRRERQTSSGMWVCSAAGSTAGSMSAGGRILPITSKSAQFVVREPYSFRGVYRLLRGFAARRIGIVAEGPGTAIWADGLRAPFEVKAGETIEIGTPGPPLRVLGYRDSRRRSIFGRG